MCTETEELSMAEVLCKNCDGCSKLAESNEGDSPCLEGCETFNLHVKIVNVFVGGEEITDQDITEVLAHLNGCSGCRAGLPGNLKQMAETGGVIRNLDKLPACLRAEVDEALED